MKSLHYITLLGVIIGFMLSGCVKQPETIVIDDSPESPQSISPQDTLSSAETSSANFKQLIIGEPHPITTLDPLFADNNSAKRAVQLLYEGLVRFNAEGEATPAIARRWRVTNDSLTYVFTLRDNIFYHDSPVFGNGLGRKLVAGDVKFAFERMARNTVPADAAHLFMSVNGFEPYFNEQHKVLNPAYRELSGVPGIQVANDTTVVFRLAERDPHFIKKMASPYASIYPREAIGQSPQDFAPVGSGPFQFSQKTGDSVYVFSNNAEYRSNKSTVPILDRVDIIIKQNESELLKALAVGEIHLIPEAGPQIVQTVTAPNGQIAPGYAENFNLCVPGGTNTYSLKYNPSSPPTLRRVRSLFTGVDYSSITAGIPQNILEITTTPDSVTADTTGNLSTILSTYSEDPYQRWFLHQLSNQWGSQPELSILKIRTPSRETALYTSSFVPYYPGQQPPAEENILVRYAAKQSVLAINEIENLQFNRYPWWMDLRTVDLSGID